jgi:excinuclease ABC subunit C
LVQRIRDEAHRFAVTFHRERRTKSTFQSALDTVDGIGPKRKKALLKHFGSVKAIREATPTEIGQVEGISSALAEQTLTAVDGAPADPASP